MKYFPDGLPLRSVMAQSGEDYTISAEAMISSLVQGGPAPQFLSAEVFNYIANTPNPIADYSGEHADMVKKVCDVD